MPSPNSDYLSRLYSPEYFPSETQACAGEKDAQLGYLDVPWVLNELASIPSGAFVDWGCGSGSLVRAVAESGRPSIGVELNERQVAGLRQSGLEAVSVLETSPLKGQCAVVHLADVLEHVPSPATTLLDAVQLLRRDGVLLIQGPLEGDQDLFSRVIRRVSAYRQAPIDMPPWHLTQFSLVGISQLLSRVGISAHIETRTVPWPAPVSVSQAGSNPRALALWALRMASRLHGRVATSPSGNRCVARGVPIDDSVGAGDSNFLG